MSFTGSSGGFSEILDVRETLVASVGSWSSWPTSAEPLLCARHSVYRSFSLYNDQMQGRPLVAPTLLRGIWSMKRLNDLPDHRVKKRQTQDLNPGSLALELLLPASVPNGPEGSMGTCRLEPRQWAASQPSLGPG